MNRQQQLQQCANNKSGHKTKLKKQTKKKQTLQTIEQN